MISDAVIGASALIAQDMTTKAVAAAVIQAAPRTGAVIQIAPSRAVTNCSRAGSATGLKGRKLGAAWGLPTARGGAV